MQMFLRRARDLRVGDKVAGRIVSSITTLNESSGEPLLLAPSGQKTAYALRFEFDDGSRVIVHPNEIPPPDELN